MRGETCDYDYFWRHSSFLNDTLMYPWIPISFAPTAANIRSVALKTRVIRSNNVECAQTLNARVCLKKNIVVRC